MVPGSLRARAYSAQHLVNRATMHSKGVGRCVINVHLGRGSAWLDVAWMVCEQVWSAAREVRQQQQRVDVATLQVCPNNNTPHAQQAG
jgi:hypothetical protein